MTTTDESRYSMFVTVVIAGAVMVAATPAPGVAPARSTTQLPYCSNRCSVGVSIQYLFVS